MTGTRRTAPSLFAILLAVALPAGAEPARGSVAGTVVDPLGARIVGASVTLLHEGKAAAEGATNGEGQFVFADVAEGRYELAASATGYVAQTARSFFVGAGD